MEKPGVSETRELENASKLDPATGRNHVKTDEKIPVLQAIRQNPIALGWCCYMIFTCIMYGYDGMASAIVLSIPKFREDYGYLWGGQYVVSAAWQLGFTAASLFGVLFGGVVTGLFQNHIGQRGCIGGAYLLTTGGVFLQWYSPGDLPMFLGGKLLTGIPLGVFLTCAPIYCSEVSPPSLRGAVVGGVNWGQVFGQFLGYCVMRETQLLSTNMSYRIMYAVQWGFAGVGLALLYFLPESPMRLVHRQKIDAARTSIIRLYPGVDAEEKLLDIQALLAQDADNQSKAGTFKDCFNTANRLRTITAMSVYFIQASSGVAWVLGYMGYFLQLGGLQGQIVFDITVAIAGLMVVGNMVGWFLIEKAGRRASIFWGLSTCTLTLLLIGVLTQFISRGSSIIYTQAAFMAIWGIAYQASIGAAGYSMVAEVPTSALRGPTQAMCTMMNGLSNGLWSLVLPYMVNPDEGAMGGNVAFVFFAFSVLGCVFVFFYYPETKGRSFEEIDELYHRGIKPRHFVKTRLESSTSYAAEE